MFHPALGSPCPPTHPALVQQVPQVQAGAWRDRLMVKPFSQECGSLWGGGTPTDTCPCMLQAHTPHDASGDQTLQPGRKEVLDRPDSCQGEGHRANSCWWDPLCQVVAEPRLPGSPAPRSSIPDWSHSSLKERTPSTPRAKGLFRDQPPTHHLRSLTPSLTLRPQALEESRSGTRVSYPTKHSGLAEGSEDNSRQTHLPGPRAG